MHLLRSITFVILATVLLFVIARADKDLFKINKLNIIMSKARHSLGSSKLKDLHSDLKKHEHDELNLKKLKAHNQDKDGLIEASVRKKLLSIMTKYSLERYHDDIGGMGPKHDNDKFKGKQELLRGIESVEPSRFRDSKLDKLWKKAEKAGFDREQLMILQEEFQHQQDKLDEHYRTSNLIAEELDKSAGDGERSKNSVEHSELKNKNKKQKSGFKQNEQDSDHKARLHANLEQALKEKHSVIKRGYQELHDKIKSGVLDQDKPFKEDPVNELWSAASKSNFTEEELTSLKEELEHYQTRIQKLKHFHNQLERQRIGVKDYTSNADEDDESKHIRKRVNELSHKVHKAHQVLVGKIVKDEL